MSGSAELLGRLEPAITAVWVPGRRVAGVIRVGRKASKVRDDLQWLPLNA